MKQYIIQAALHEEANEGWIWARDCDSRAIVCITNPANSRSVYCQVREIDDNFLRQYNKEPRTPITEMDTLVISQWYRQALGISEHQRTTDRVNLLIKPLRDLPFRLWGSVRATAHHPEIVVRMGASLGVLGFGLGLVSLLPSLLTIVGILGICQDYFVLGGAALVFLGGWLSCRRPKLTRSP